VSNLAFEIEQATQRAAVAADKMEQAIAAIGDAADDLDPNIRSGLEDAVRASESEVNEAVAHRDNLVKLQEARSKVYRTAQPLDTNTPEPENTGGAATQPGKVAIRVGKEPLTYERNGRHSFVADMVKRESDTAAAERLKRHLHEMAVERRDLSSSSTSGGDFIAPVYLANEWLDVARANRVISNLGKNLGAPPRNASFTIPRLNTDAGVGVQASDNAAITESDAVTATLTVQREVIAGLQDVSQQSLDDTTPGLDQIIFNSLARQYGLKVNSQVLTGSGSSGQIRGIDNTSSIITVSYTDASPTGPEFLTVLYGAISQVSTQRFASPTAIVMHPRRWFWLANSVDGNGRPLVVPMGYGNQSVNAFGINPGPEAMGLVGSLAGLPVYADPGITTANGAGTNEDKVYVLHADDLMRWEDATPRAETFRDIGSATLTVRFRVYGYFAYTAGAYPKSVAIISGTGLTAPAGF
jgi:HK97 family phage major capsid protein